MPNDESPRNGCLTVAAIVCLAVGIFTVGTLVIGVVVRGLWHTVVR